MIRLLVLVIISFFGLAPAFADLLIFPNGDRLTGQFLGSENGTLRFQSVHFGEITVPQSEVELILEEAPPALPTTPVAKQTQVGPIAPIGPEKTQEDPLGRFIPTWVRDFFRYTKLPEPWKGEFELGFLWQRGERHRDDIFVRLAVEREGKKTEIRAQASYEYGTLENSAGETERNRDRLEGDLRYRYNLDPTLFVQSNTRYQQLPLRGIQREGEQSVGFGWRYLDGPRLRGTLTPALSGRYRELSDATEDELALFTTLFQDFRLKLNSRLTLAQEFAFSLDPVETSSYSVDFETRLESHLTDRLTLNLRWVYDFDTDVVAGVDREQHRASLTFGYDF